MGLGETVGFSTRLWHDGSNPLVFSRGLKLVHVALMGDPTLRMHPVLPASGLFVFTNQTGTNLTWNPSPDTIVGYHVYRAPTAAGPFVRLNETLLVSTNFTNPVVSTDVYMVRAVKLEVNPSGSYYNSSQGVFQDLAGTFGPPRLHISSVDSGVALSWLTSNFEYHREATTSLAPTNWMSVSNSVPPTPCSGHYWFALNGSNHFFRLRRF